MSHRRRLAATLAAAWALSGVVIAPSAASAAGAGCSLEDDLVVGTPAEDVGSVVDAGAVTVVYGGPAGFGSAGAMMLTQETIGQVSEAGDRFGAVVTTADLIGDACSELIIGVPGEDERTGQVVVVPGSATGPGGTPMILRQGAARVAGTAEVGDTFGASLDVTSYDEDGPVRRLWVGAPFEDVGAAVDAGAVTRIELYPGPGVVESREYVQGVDGVPDVAESGDRFGAALDAVDLGFEPGRWTVIGVPGEDMGSVPDAGAVLLVGGTDDYRFFTQDTPTVPGIAEAGDRFGASVATEVGAECPSEGPGIAIGAPGEDVGSVVNAGSVTYLSAPPPIDRSRHTAVLITDGLVEPYDRFGSTLISSGGLVIGTPGENVGLVNDAGAVTVQPIGCDFEEEHQEVGRRFLVTQDSRGVPGVAERGDAFGASLGLVRSTCTSEGCCGGAVVVGAPGESVGRIPAAGAVTLFTRFPTKSTAAVSCGLTQSSAGVPGASEAGDRFGTALMH